VCVLTISNMWAQKLAS